MVIRQETALAAPAPASAPAALIPSKRKPAAVDLSTVPAPLLSRANRTVTPLVEGVMAGRGAMAAAGKDKEARKEAQVALKKMRVDAMATLRAAHKDARTKAAIAARLATENDPDVVATRVALQLFNQRLAVTRPDKPKTAHATPTDAPGDATVVVAPTENANVDAEAKARRRAARQSKGHGKVPGIGIGRIDLDTATAAQKARAEATVGPLATRLMALEAAVRASADKPSRQAARKAANQTRKEVAASLQAARKAAREDFDAAAGDDSQREQHRARLIDARLAIQQFQRTVATISPRPTLGDATVPEAEPTGALESPADTVAPFPQAPTDPLDGHAPADALANAEPEPEPKSAISTMKKAQKANHAVPKEIQRAALAAVDQADNALQPLRDAVTAATDNPSRRAANQALKKATAETMQRFQRARVEAKAAVDAAVDKPAKRKLQPALRLARVTVQTFKQRMQAAGLKSPA